MLYFVFLPNALKMEHFGEDEVKQHHIHFTRKALLCHIITMGKYKATGDLE